MTQRQAPYHLDVVVPCFNEKDALPLTTPCLLAHFRELVASPDYRLAAFRILLVDDGSTDETWALIEGLAKANPEVEGIRLSRNYGHQAAMLAGLSHASADAVITIDADLQDDLAAIAAMLAAFEGGSDLALGVRNDRSSDSFQKQGIARTYYRFLVALGVNIVPDHADFRLTSRRALDALLLHREVNLFLRGLIPSLGFVVTLVPYARQSRNAGEPKYTLRKLSRLAFDGITSFSIAPLRIVSVAGALVFVGAMLMGAIFLYLRLAHSAEIVPGWASTVLPLLFLGGMQLLSIGVMGEYIGKIYLETKARPRFLVQETTAGEG